jgi:hypothetical protein
MTLFPKQSTLKHKYYVDNRCLDEEKGNLICNPENNNERCDYDKGDCCRPVIECSNTSLSCNCHLTNIQHKTYQGMYTFREMAAITV